MWKNVICLHVRRNFSYKWESFGKVILHGLNFYWTQELRWQLYLVLRKNKMMSCKAGKMPLCIRLLKRATWLIAFIYYQMNEKFSVFTWNVRVCQWKELVHFRFCRQENPEGNFQNRNQLFFMKLLQGWLNPIILTKVTLSRRSTFFQ